MKKIYDMLKQEIKVGSKVLYFKKIGFSTEPLKAAVMDIKIIQGERGDNFTITLNCGIYFGIIKARNPKRMLVIDSLDIDMSCWIDR